MQTVLFIVGILLFGLAINIVLRQSYNFIFVFARQPVLWIVFVGMVAVGAWWLSASMDWNVNVPIWASTIALLANAPIGVTKEVGQLADEIYADMGMKRGRLMFRLGLTVFALACFSSWIALYGQSCTHDGRCTPFFM